MASFGGMMVFEAAKVSIACVVMMMRFLLQDAQTLQNLIANDQRFPFSELRKKDTTEPEAKDGSDTEDDDDEDDNDAEEPEDDAGDEDFSVFELEIAVHASTGQRRS
ncbi:hypothetical protein CTI12_AA081450 [Artemisia annua]|uniref:Uncharacterized protein n=1 Tax=Artemisia annua TaxID=35608 RepID=A0A2U1Q2R0_ARTAN|nr:hypothetical protein CTI12_AA081450 [Artemisia annua]